MSRNATLDPTFQAIVNGFSPDVPDQAAALRARFADVEQPKPFTGPPSFIHRQHAVLITHNAEAVSARYRVNIILPDGSLRWHGASSEKAANESAVIEIDRLIRDGQSNETL